MSRRSHPPHRRRLPGATSSRSTCANSSRLKKGRGRSPPSRGSLEGVNGPGCIYPFMPETDITDYYASVSLVGMDLVEVSLSQARDVGAERVAGLAAESLIQYVDDDAQFCLTGTGRDDFGFEIAALEERGPSGVSG
jgi:hypothetical protein